MHYIYVGKTDSVEAEQADGDWGERMCEGLPPVSNQVSEHTFGGLLIFSRWHNLGQRGGERLH